MNIGSLCISHVTTAFFSCDLRYDFALMREIDYSQLSYPSSFVAKQYKLRK